MARFVYNLKLVVEVDTTRDPNEVATRLDGLFDAAKTRVRQLVRNLNPPITIVAWHYHLSTGAVDEPEP